jgi:O-antigen/teichoic acid export membrane protein
MALKRNIIANYLGQGWSAFVAIVFVPTYIKYLGMEAYGLIGFFTMLQIWMSALDMGMTPTLNREIVRYKSGVISHQDILDLMRTFEWIACALVILIFCTVWLSAPIIANSWLKVSAIPIFIVIQVVILIGFVVSSKLIEEVYRGAIRGMQQHVWLNGAQAILATLRWLGVFLLLTFISKTILAFFIWQAFVSVLSVLLYAKKTYQLMPSSKERGQFSLNAIKSIKGFAGGMILISLFALLLTQVDKLLLSGLLTLEQFGYYALAGLVAGGVSQLISPINAALYPKFTEQISRGAYDELVRTYHNATQLMALIIIPPCLLIIAFSEPLLQIWTGNSIIVHNVAPLLELLVVGAMCNGFVNVPYILQLSYGWTSLTIRINAIAVAIIVPAILFFVPRYGAISAAWIWVILNLGYLFIGPNFMYRHIMQKEKLKWFNAAIFLPLIVGILVSFVSRYFFINHMTYIYTIIYLVITLFAMGAAVTFATPLGWNIIFRNFNATKKYFS